LLEVDPEKEAFPVSTAAVVYASAAGVAAIYAISGIGVSSELS